MDDPQLRTKLETLMLVYPNVTVARALMFLDEANSMIEEARASRKLSPAEFDLLTREPADETTEILDLDASEIRAMREEDFNR